MGDFKSQVTGVKNITPTAKTFNFELNTKLIGVLF
jgi:hypothetical protein